MSNWFRKLADDTRVLSLAPWERWLLASIHDQCEREGTRGMKFVPLVMDSRLMLGVGEPEIARALMLMAKLGLVVMNKLEVETGDWAAFSIEPIRIDKRAFNGARDRSHMANLAVKRWNNAESKRKTDENPQRNPHDSHDPQESASLLPSVLPSSSPAPSSPSLFISPPLLNSAVPAGTTARQRGFGEVKEHWMEAYRSETGKEYYWLAKDAVACNHLLAAVKNNVAEAKLLIGKFIGRARRDPFWTRRGLAMTLVASSVNGLQGTTEEITKATGAHLKIKKDDFRIAGRADL